MKIASSIFALILCTLIGYMRAYKSKEHMDIISGFLEDIRKISMQIEFTSEPICMILERIKQSSKLPLIWESLQKYLNEGDDCNAAWKKISQEEVFHLLSDEELSGLENFFMTLGKSDIDSQKKNIAHTYKNLDAIKERLEKENNNKQRMYKRLGPLIGAAFALLII